MPWKEIRAYIRHLLPRCGFWGHNNPGWWLLGSTSESRKKRHWHFTIPNLRMEHHISLFRSLIILQIIHNLEKFSFWGLGNVSRNGTKQPSRPKVRNPSTFLFLSSSKFNKRLRGSREYISFIHLRFAQIFLYFVTYPFSESFTFGETTTPEFKVVFFFSYLASRSYSFLDLLNPCLNFAPAGSTDNPLQT